MRGNGYTPNWYFQRRASDDRRTRRMLISALGVRRFKKATREAKREATR